MPRQYKKGVIRRAKAKNIQGWFSPDDPAENKVIELFESLRYNLGSNKRVIMACADAYLREAGKTVDDTSVSVQLEAHTVDAIRTLFSLIAELKAMTARQVYIADDADFDTRRVEVFDELDAIQQSIGGRYKAIPLDDEDE